MGPEGSRQLVRLEAGYRMVVCVGGWVVLNADVPVWVRTGLFGSAQTLCSLPSCQTRTPQSPAVKQHACLRTVTDSTLLSTIVSALWG